MLEGERSVGDALGRHRFHEILHQRGLEADPLENLAQPVDFRLPATVHPREMVDQFAQVLVSQHGKGQQLRELIHRTARARHHPGHAFLRGSGEHGGDLLPALMQHGAQRGDDLLAAGHLAERLDFVEHQQQRLAGQACQPAHECVEPQLWSFGKGSTLRRLAELQACADGADLPYGCLGHARDLALGHRRVIDGLFDGVVDGLQRCRPMQPHVGVDRQESGLRPCRCQVMVKEERSCRPVAGQTGRSADGAAQRGNERSAGIRSRWRCVSGTVAGSPLRGSSRGRHRAAAEPRR